MTTNGAKVEEVNIVIDGKPLRVAKGTNVIEAAKQAGVVIPHYCYHPHLSIAGNCRMCQVKVKGAPKMDIACNMLVKEGLEVQTHESSKEVADAQAAVLEFILINHPLDCTVCDQSGHCKLQDYHFDYNARPSRFLEEKVHKVKAEPLGENVILDGERCIMCTRCIRFCDEITKTSELGMLQRGDKSVIAINQAKPLDNELSGTVVDLCPVGALTHRKWRFNTRIWYTNETDSICPGCSTGCNVRVAVRNSEVVQVKARFNAEVNKEWLCDEGRYGFMRFLPKQRISEPWISGVAASWEKALKEAKVRLTENPLVLLSPDLMLEEYALLQTLLAKYTKNPTVALAYRKRKLNAVETVLISPDYAANYRAAEFLGLVSGDLEAGYQEALANLAAKQFQSVLLIGERAILKEDQNQTLLATLTSMPGVVALITDAASPLVDCCSVVLPARSILEKSGLLLNQSSRLQYAERVIEFPSGTEPHWRILNMLAAELGTKLCQSQNDRELTLWFLGTEIAAARGLKGLTIQKIKAGGVRLDSFGGTRGEKVSMGEAVSP